MTADRNYSVRHCEETFRFTFQKIFPGTLGEIRIIPLKPMKFYPVLSGLMWPLCLKKKGMGILRHLQNSSDLERSTMTLPLENASIMAVRPVQFHTDNSLVFFIMSFILIRVVTCFRNPSYSSLCAHSPKNYSNFFKAHEGYRLSYLKS